MATVSRAMEPERLRDASVLRPGTRVHHYRILEKLGEGGFAVVYLAEQHEPVRRRVALKILKLGTDSKEIVARFEAERQALALMDHANVAKVLDAGTTENGRPYFAMEYVAGAQITEYCDRNKLSVEERLAVFSTVCDAIQHAHQKAIIHRDIKPSNVLVAHQGGDRVAKVIDFGVAKATNYRLTEKTIHTESGQLLGTPTYMSPEQAEMSNEKIDTRTDVYSLGMLLYELLAGTLPFDAEALKTASLFEIQSFIRSVDIPKPSDRLRGLGDDTKRIAENRRSDPKALFRELRGDLDWVTLKALEKERSRRYDTPRALAQDLQRYLMDEAVEASPPSLVYRAKKFVRRHTAGVVAASVTLLALIVIAVTMTLDARRLAAQRDAAEKARAELEQVVTFQTQQLRQLDTESVGESIRKHLFSQHQASTQRSNLAADEIDRQRATLHRILSGTSFTDIALHTVDENIFAAMKRAVDEQFGEASLVRARLLQSLATTMGEVGLLDAANDPQAEALDVRRRVLGDDHPDTLASLAGLGRLRQQQGRSKEAETHIRAALTGRRLRLGAQHVDTLSSLNDLCNNLFEQGRLDAAEPYCRESLHSTRDVLGGEHRQTGRAMVGFGRLLVLQGKLAEAEPYIREAVAIQRRALGSDHPDTLVAVNNLGILLKEMGRLEEAEPFYREVLEGTRRRLGNDHVYALVATNNMGSLLSNLGKFDQAEPYFRTALSGRQRLLGDRHPHTLGSVANMGSLRLQQGRFAEAEPLLRKALDGCRQVFGNEHPNTRAMVNALALAQSKQARFRESEALLRKGLPVHIEALGDEHWRTAEARSLLGEALTGQRRYEEAEPLLLESLKDLEAALPEGRRPVKLLPAIRRVAKLYDAWGKPKKAAEWRAKLSP